MKKIIMVIITITLSLVGFFLLPESGGEVISTLIQDNGKIEVYFCPEEKCESTFLEFLDSAKKSIHCALFEVGLESVQNKLLEKEKELDVLVITDDQYLKEFNYPFVKADSWGLQHNKFCIVDGEKLSTGSMNPTNNGVNKNNNHLLLINSIVLSENYENEFQEMWRGEFKKGEKVVNPEILLSGINIKNYFCPEDNCAFHVKEELKKAKENINFMTFSFTHEGIANVLLLKNLDGLLVRGVMETQQISQYSQYNRLVGSGIDVVKDSNKNNMHHKVFIIDQKTVITGSFNPSNGGDEKNDENILIIEDKEIASQFMEEFNRIWERKQ